MTRLLSIVWYKVLPARFGGQKGIALFNSHIAKRFALTCLCSSNNVTSEPLSYQLIPSLPEGRGQFANPIVWWRILNTVSKVNASHLILEHPYHGIAGRLARKFRKIFLIVHSHNIEYLRFREQGKWWWRLLFMLERWTHRGADLNLFKTRADLEHALIHFRLQRNRCIVIPYGTERWNFQFSEMEARQMICEQYGIDPNDKILLFTGTLDYEPNAKAVENIYNEIAPLLVADGSLSFSIIVCGRNKFPEFSYLKSLYHPRVIQAGEVREIEHYYRAADIFINPVMQHTGVQTKTLDALAAGLPVVAFPDPGIEENYRGLETVDKGNWQGFVAAVITMLQKNLKNNTEPPPGWDQRITEFTERLHSIPKSRR